uniref:Uncharacterized protein n=1 Tax=Aplanochytrium stocchinoi TaxID=215587 RepID=A0A7S3V2L4_9STRA
MRLFGMFLQAIQSVDNGQRLAISCLGSARESLDFMIQVFDSLIKEVDKSLAQNFIESVVSLISSHNCISSLLSLGRGGLLLLHKLMRLIGMVVSCPNSAFLVSSNSNIRAGIVHLCFDQLYSALSGRTTVGESNSALLDLREMHYQLMHKILSSRWNWFFKPINREFESEEGNKFFVKAMEIYFSSFQDMTLPPSTYGYNLSVFNDLQKVHKLYSVQLFKTEMLPAFTETLLTAMMDGSRQILHDELVLTVFGLASADFNLFFGQIVPRFVSKYSNPQATIPNFATSTDFPSFSRNLKFFINDIKV